MKMLVASKVLLLIVGLQLLALPAISQDQIVRERVREPAQDQRREGGISRDQIVEQQEIQQQGDRQEGFEEGMPQVRSRDDQQRIVPHVVPPDYSSQWKLGVFAYNTDTGVVITRVVPRSAAWQAGLEPGDRIVSVDGFQVGWIRDWLYPLGGELQRAAGRRGLVRLLVQNVRNDELLNLDVQLDRAR